MSYLIGFLIMGSYACENNDSGREATGGNKTYEIITLERGSMRGEFSLPGELKPFEAVNIYPKTTGFIKSIRVDRGSKVKKNDILAEVEAPEILAELAAAEARMRAAEGELTKSHAVLATTQDRYERIKRTSATQGAVSAGDLLHIGNQLKEDSAHYAAALSRLDAAKSTLEAYRQMGEYLIIRAPFDGIITERNVHTGTFIGRQGGENGTPLFRLEMNQKLRLEIPVPENYAGMEYQKDSITFTVNTHPGKTYYSSIRRQAGSLSTQTRTQMIEADLENEDLELVGGSFAQVKLTYTKENTFTIPVSALITNMEDRFVLKVENETAERVSVRKGFEANGKVEIFGNLQKGDRILLNPSDHLQTGDRVKTR